MFLVIQVFGYVSEGDFELKLGRFLCSACRLRATIQLIQLGLELVSAQFNEITPLKSKIQPLTDPYETIQNLIL